MALSEVKLCNLALSAIGVSTQIASLADTTRPAEVCNLWIEPVREMVMASAPWSSLTSYTRLANQNDRDVEADWVATDPAPGWLYSYDIPSTMLWPRYLSNFSLFEMSSVNGTRKLMTNDEAPILVFTRNDVTNPTLWDNGLQNAVRCMLAAHICKDLNGKDTDLRNNFNMAEEVILRVRAAEANVGQNKPLDWPLPDWFSARGASDTRPATSYIYPPGNYSLLTQAPLV